MNANIIRQYRRIHNWENFFIDSAVYSVGQSAGIEYEDGFQPVAAVTGDLFAYMYSSEKPCDSGMTNYFFLPEAIERAYSLFGYECIYLSNHAIQEDIDAALAQIRRSVDRGIPVFAWGCGGVEMEGGSRWDPLPEGCLIGGYDMDDGMIYVNLYPGEERLARTSAGHRPGVDEYGYTAIDAACALATTKGLFILGDKAAEPDMREIYREVLFAIPQWLAMPAKDGYAFGEEAFERWALTLQNDEYWQDAQMAEAHCWDMHCSAYCAICTSIGVGEGEGIAGYMLKLSSALQDVPEAEAALPLFMRLRTLNQAIWTYQGGFMPPFDRLAEHEYRAHIADLLHEMGKTCRQILAVFSPGMINL